MTSLRRAFLAGLGFVLLASPVAAAPTGPGVVEIEASPALLAAARGLGADVAFFTSRTKPIKRIADLVQPQREVASPHLGLARGVMGLLRAGGVTLDTGAAELMTLVGERHLPRIFAGPVRLVIVRGEEAARVTQAGGVPVVFRGAGGEEVGAAKEGAAAAGAAGAGKAAGETSFGPLTSARAVGTARARKAEMEKVKVETLTARPGHQFVVLTIARDFGRGVGAVSFLYGSGIIVEPAFDQLVLEVGGKRFAPRAVNAEGLTLELGYEVPAGAKKAVLVDGAARVPIDVTGAAS